MRPTNPIKRTKEGWLVQEADESDSCHVAIPVGMMNWELLERQKLSLCKFLEKRPNHILWGVVGLIDSIQDRASDAGHPVVWFEESLEKDQAQIQE